MKKIPIRTEFITLGQFLKLADIISTGGEAKFYLQNNVIYVDNIVDNRRGRKLYPGTILKCSNEEYEIVKDDNQES
ncbi:MAG: S4 domain-containing protein YaaA [Bacilli bacterium]